MWIKVKAQEKKKRKRFYWRSKNISAKNSAAPTKSTPALFRTSLLNNTTQIIIAMQMLDDNQTRSNSWITIAKTNMKQNTLRLQKIIYESWKRKKVVWSDHFFVRLKQERNFFPPEYHYFFYRWISDNWQFHFSRACVCLNVPIL